MELLLFTLVVLGSVCGQFVDHRNFFPRRLKTFDDCLFYATQARFVNVKCDVFFKDFEMFIDPQFRTRFRECIDPMKDIKDFTPNVFYRIRGLNELTGNHIDLMTILAADMEYFVQIIPIVNFFLGPAGNESSIMKNARDIASAVALGVAETEYLSDSYTEEFFSNLSLAKGVAETHPRILVLNGWHLVNVPFSIQMNTSFADLFDGIVVWVREEKAKYISRQEVLNYARTFRVPTYLDMYGSPNAGRSWLEVNRLMEILLSLVVIIVFFWLTQE